MPALPHAAVSGGKNVRNHVRHGSEAVKDKFAGSSAEYLWRRLDGLEFVNRGLIFAATLLLCFFPFFIIVNALLGRSAVTGLSRHLGLDSQAAADLDHLLASSVRTSDAVSGFAWVFFILSGIAAAMAVQELYERAFDLDRRGMKDVGRQVLWLAFLVACGTFSDWAGPRLEHSGGPVAFVIAALIALTAFWWVTMRLLLGGRVAWRRLLPAAIATAVFWAGMELVFSFTFSGMVVSDNQKYGPIGVVFSLMSWLIAIGVVLILGAVVGVVWQDRNLGFGKALAKLQRRPRPRT
jgi:membrane protein